MRGELITIALQGDFGKPRPALVIQADVFSALDSVTVIPLTSALHETPLIRFTLHPAKGNGLRKVSQLAIDKIQTVHRNKVGNAFGKISTTELIEVERLVAAFLGISE
ncbi:MAG: growth inhibitor PemK [Gammaproteobacteria bacterium RIFCSPHIGHO2_12_FULL_42_13]|nr:MAG: growth inhibitor PemK [Gammaproteobacteria bacterium RIFCSPHIGHO2_12_FULL_42_13]